MVLRTAQGMALLVPQCSAAMAAAVIPAIVRVFRAAFPSRPVSQILHVDAAFVVNDVARELLAPPPPRSLAEPCGVLQPRSCRRRYRHSPCLPRAVYLLPLPLRQVNFGEPTSMPVTITMLPLVSPAFAK